MIHCVKCGKDRRNRKAINTTIGIICGVCLSKKSKKAFKNWKLKNPFVKIMDVATSPTVIQENNLIVRTRKLFRKLTGRDKK